ncbi:serine/threonine-protein kinase [uncultured Tateyamaria sp.]|uniref:serine/threonine-protein kinase n=1 Tax=uncultured Tateyamaria sp. TaxID=455651 RepID=UPI002613D3C8|nr:serine/threonine-protein kinase [uncultured Tateyamaria sp.]
MTGQLPGDIFTVGQVLNNTYQVDRILGRGGTGEVYLASNKITGRKVAIKALNRNFSGNADYIELMKREEQIRAIHHDAVVRYTECSLSDDGHVFLVMDFVDGPPLSDEMARRQMSERELLIILHRVLVGLEATHNKGIIHRDLSPDNIILKEGDPAQATIIDFGIAKDTASGAKTIVGSDFAGKYEYSAPEQIDGQVDARSDLYALGATLLAAFRGETPFASAAVGEIIRRKQSALDTTGVPDRLKGFIDRLTAPDPNSRPASAAEVLRDVDMAIAPSGRPTEQKEKPRKKQAFVPVFAMLGLVAVGGGLWLAGVFDPPPPLETYRLDFEFDTSGPPTLTTFAPTDEDATALKASVTAAFGTAPTGNITLARGVPSDQWIKNASDIISALAPLESGDLRVLEQTAQITGLAANVAEKSTVIQNLRTFAASTGWTITSDLNAGPLVVTMADVQSTLVGLADCGPLEVSGDTDGRFGLTAAIEIQGNVADATTRTALTDGLTPRIGERGLNVQVDVLNPQLCAIRQILDDVPIGDVSIALSNGETGERNLSGVFTTGQNPVVDILVPDTYADGALWVMAVNPDGTLFHLVPNINRQENRIAEMAEVEGGLRRIRVLHTIDEFLADNSKAATRIADTNYGKSEIIAILSDESLFDGLYPTTMSVDGTVEALEEVMKTRPENVRAVRFSIIDARP